ncbi:hypothetical protein, partial [Ralstonia sp. ASV6]|uniref:hypothetical protein n=2 Tax=Ralstonia TaxID=48736 RepID=UPI001E2C08C7
MLKNFAINFVYRVAAFAAAEKRDYAELFRRCQQLAEEFLSFNALLTHYRDTHPINTTNRPETRTTSTSPPPRHHRLNLRFGAASCSEGRTI